MAIITKSDKRSYNKNKQNSFEEKINPTNIRSGGSASVLTKMFFTIMSNMAINETRWNHLMTNYILDKNNCIPSNTKDQSSARGNLSKELLKSQQTWKVFCKALRFLNIVKFEFIIRAHHPNGKVTESMVPVSFGDMVYESEDHPDETEEITKDV